MVSPISITLILRFIQASLTIISIALGIAFLNSYEKDNSYIASVVAVSSISFIHLVVTSILPIFRLIPFVVVLLMELLMLGLWILEFVFMSQQFANYGSCSGTVTNGAQEVAFSYDWCRIGKALIAITLFDWMALLAALIAVIHFSVIPIIRTFGWSNYLSSQRNTYISGCIFCKMPDMEPKHREKSTTRTTTRARHYEKRDPSSESERSQSVDLSEYSYHHSTSHGNAPPSPAKFSPGTNLISKVVNSVHSRPSRIEFASDVPKSIITKVNEMIGETDSIGSKYYVVRIDAKSDV